MSMGNMRRKDLEDMKILALASYISRRSRWLDVLDVLYKSEIPLTINEIDVRIENLIRRGIILGDKIDRRSIRYVLRRCREMGIVASLEIKGLRGVRWYLTDIGRKVYEKIMGKE
jgi:DNA-binding transcriptional ArsR family regulator